MVLRITDIMFLHDPLNEEALAAKCSVLFLEGKKVLPKVFMTVSVKSTVNLLEKIIRYHSPNYANNLNLFIIKRLIEKLSAFLMPN